MPYAPDKWKSVQIRFPKELHKWLKKEAFDKEESFNAFVVRAVQDAKSRAEYRKGMEEANE